MAEKEKNDQRVRMTKKMLRSALIELLQKKPLQSITVKELCSHAGINRGTFYSHYYDIYDLMEKIENEMFSELQEALSNYPLADTSSSVSNPLSIYSAVFAILSENYDMCAILLGENCDKSFIDKVISFGKEKCLEQYQELYPSVNRRDIEFFYAFVASGYLATLRLWLEGGRKEPVSEMAKKTEKIILGSVRFLEDAAKNTEK